MSNNLSRRKFIAASTAIGSAHLLSKKSQAQSDKVTVIGISCSPRKGFTTAKSVQAALDAAQKVDPRLKTELLDLGGMDISGWGVGPQADISNPSPDDFELLLPSLKGPMLGGIIIGSPVYFRNMSSLCASFLERLSVLRKPTLLLANKAVGALSVGAYRNGGQELVIQQIQAAMLCHEAVIVGGKPGAFQGATLWNAYKDDIFKDEFGIKSAQNLGIRVAEAALALVNV